MVESLDERDNTVDVPDDPESVDEEQFIVWMKNHGEAIKDVLSEMTAVYHNDDEKMEIRNAPISHAPPSEDYIGIQFDLPNDMDPDVEGANILRLLDDLTAHEVAHLNYSPLESKQEFVECYPGWGQLPGSVCNTLEDEYIDAERQRNYHGMREKLAFYTWLHMNTDKRSPPVDETYEEEGMANALENGLLQLALSGFVKGIEDAPDEVGAALSEIEPFIERVRTTHDPEKRELLMHATMMTLAKYLDDPDEFDPDEAKERRRDKADAPDAPDADSPDIDLPDEMKDAMEEMIEEMAEEMDDEELPTPDVDDMPDSGDAMGELSLDPDIETDSDTADDPGGSGDGESEPDADDTPDSLADLFDDDSTAGDDTDGSGSDADDTEPTESDTAGDTGDTAGDGGSDGDDTKRDMRAIVDEYGADSLTVTE